MKKLITLFAASAALTGSIIAGETTVHSGKTMTPPPPPEPVLYGVGWYGAIDGGVNVFQDYGGDRNFTRAGRTISIEPRESVGGFGGLKLGYVFGTGTVRPAIEADAYYNGVQSSVKVKVDGNEVASANSRIDSGAFMGNFLLRFNFERFQPYIGAGAGYWIAEGNDVSFTIRGQTKQHADTGSKGDFAWQIVGGADYYFTPKFSTFLEYKFLNYENGFFDNAVRQQLIALGFRIHF